MGAPKGRCRHQKANGVPLRQIWEAKGKWAAIKANVGAERQMGHHKGGARRQMGHQKGIWVPKGIWGAIKAYGVPKRHMGARRQMGRQKKHMGAKRQMGRQKGKWMP